jgi:hypothetical protein
MLHQVKFDENEEFAEFAEFDTVESDSTYMTW